MTANKKRWSNPDEHKKMSKFIAERNKENNFRTGTKLPDNIKKTISEKVKELWQDPEYRERQSLAHIGSKGYWSGKKRSKETKRKISESKKKLLNHKIINIERLGIFDEVWDIEVEGHHNFATSAGVFIHNSIDSKQILEVKGYRVENLSIDRTMQPYCDLKESINENRLDYYCVNPNNIPFEQRMNLKNSELTASEVFVKECMKLEEIEAKKVNHPPKGCTSADTAILYNGKTKDIGEIVGEESFEVIGYKDGEFIKTKARNARITKYVKELIEIEFEDGSHLKCTPEHPILLDNDEWIQAQYLKEDDNVKCLTTV